MGKVYQRNTSRDAFLAPPSDAGEFSGHAGMAEEQWIYGREVDAKTLLRYGYGLSPDMTVDDTGQLVETTGPTRPDES